MSKRDDDPPQTKPSSKAANHNWEYGLVGLHFDVYGEGGTIDRSGIIRAGIGDNYLVEFIDPADPRDRLAVVPINKILEPSGDRYGPGAWSLRTE